MPLPTGVSWSRLGTALGSTTTPEAPVSTSSGTALPLLIDTLATGWVVDLIWIGTTA